MIFWSVSLFSCAFLCTILLHFGEGGTVVVARNLTEEEIDFSTNSTKNSTSRDKRNGVLGLYLNPHDPLSRIAAVLWAKLFERPYAPPTKPQHHLTGIVHTITTVGSTTEKPTTSTENVTPTTDDIMMTIELPHSMTTSGPSSDQQMTFMSTSTEIPLTTRPTTMTPPVKPSGPESPSSEEKPSGPVVAKPTVKPSGPEITNPNQPMKPPQVNPGGFPGQGGGHGPGQVQQPQNPGFPNQPQHPSGYPPGQHPGQGGQGNPNFPGQGQGNPNYPGQGNPNFPGQINNPNFPGQGNPNFPPPQRPPQNVPGGGGGFPNQPGGPGGFPPGQQPNFPQNQNPGQRPPQGGGGPIFGQPQMPHFQNQRPPGVQGIIRLGGGSGGSNKQALYQLNQQQQTIEAQLPQPPFQDSPTNNNLQSQDQLYEFLSTQQQQEFNAAINNHYNNPQQQVDKNNDGQIVVINSGGHSNYNNNNNSTASNLEQRPILVYHQPSGNGGNGGQSGNFLDFQSSLNNASILDEASKSKLQVFPFHSLLFVFPMSGNVSLGRGSFSHADQGTARNHVANGKCGINSTICSL